MLNEEARQTRGPAVCPIHVRYKAGRAHAQWGCPEPSPACLVARGPGGFWELAAFCF